MARLLKVTGSLSAAAFILTWVYFVFVVWMSDHPAVANYVYTSLRINTFNLMFGLSAFGAITGFLADIMILLGATGRRISGATRHASNLLTLALLIAIPKAVL